MKIFPKIFTETLLNNLISVGESVDCVCYVSLVLAFTTLSAYLFSVDRTIGLLEVEFGKNFKGLDLIENITEHLIDWTESHTKTC